VIKTRVILLEPKDGVDVVFALDSDDFAYALPKRSVDARRILFADELDMRLEKGDQFALDDKTSGRFVYEVVLITVVREPNGLVLPRDLLVAHVVPVKDFTTFHWRKNNG